MNSLLKVVSFLSLCMLLVACPKDDGPAASAPRPYTEVYPENLSLIEDFLKTHYIKDPVDTNDYNVEFDTLIDNTHTSIFNDSRLTYKTLNLHDIPGGYKVYYLKINEGVGENATKMDSSFVAYKGTFLEYKKKSVTNNNVTTTITYMKKKLFDYAPNPVWFKLDEVVTGWGLIIPEFKTAGTPISNSDGTFTYPGFGEGVMFLPSGLGYYATGAGGIPAYAPLVFSFRTMKLRRRDHDQDKIESRFEFGDLTSRTGIDSDGDGAPDFFDTDDDNDGYLTKNEIKYMDTATPPVAHYYEFANIPICSDGKKKHLTATCH